MENLHLKNLKELDLIDTNLEKNTWIKYQTWKIINSNTRIFNKWIKTNKYL